MTKEATPLETHSFESTVQPTLNALSLESLRDMQVLIATRIRELEIVSQVKTNDNRQRAINLLNMMALPLDEARIQMIANVLHIWKVGEPNGL